MEVLGKKISMIAGDGKSDDNLSPQRWSTDEIAVRTDHCPCLHHVHLLLGDQIGTYYYIRD
jgi:hypothetical protein